MNNISKIRLGDILNFKRGYDLPQSKRENGLIPVISSSGVSGFHSKYKVKGEGIIIGRYGTLGEVYYVNEKYWPHNTTLYVTDFKANYPRYVFYLLKCLGNLKTSDKSTVPGINRNDLHEVVVQFVNSLNYQKKIAKVLSDLDAKIEVNNKINQDLEAMAKTLYDYWFVQFDFPDTYGKSYKSSGGKMVFNEALKREIPESWEACILGDVVAKTGTGLNPRKHFVLGEGDNYYVTIKNIKQGQIVLDDRCDKITDESLEIINNRSDLRIGDILYTSIEPVGTTYLLRSKPTNWNINESVFTIRPDINKISSEFLYMFLSGDYIKAYTKNVSAGSIHKGVRHGTLKESQFILPNKEIIDSFSNKMNPILDKLELIQKENQKLSELRDWLLPMLMNGQVTVGEGQEYINMAAEPQEKYGN